MQLKNVHIDNPHNRQINKNPTKNYKEYECIPIPATKGDSNLNPLAWVRLNPDGVKSYQCDRDKIRQKPWVKTTKSWVRLWKSGKCAHYYYYYLLFTYHLTKCITRGY